MKAEASLTAAGCGAILLLREAKPPTKRRPLPRQGPRRRPYDGRSATRESPREEAPLPRLFECAGWKKSVLFLRYERRGDWSAPCFPGGKPQHSTAAARAAFTRYRGESTWPL